MEFSTRRRARRAGFTLVEMLIVLGILVLLFAMVVPRFLGSQKKAKIDTVKTQVGMFRGALEHYYLDADQFPATEQGLQALLAKPADLPDNVAWHGPYVSGEIGNDPWGNPYQYEYPPTHGTADTPDIWSYGPDGTEGTEDDICSWTPGGGQSGGETAPGETMEPGAGKAARASRTPRERPAAGPKGSGMSSGAAPASPKPPRAAAPKAVRSDDL